ncbi:hypothetical protein HPB51_009576 [Rhipicephalus microplus]|uniref:Uncharacterized protein n=1 Tax=Rhipicephalus microplus TaxID=6941 RepID=A0A9J6ESM1_RHIMP|nr:hypothetical protein HPB51_009576 [Rhipicephalus microplus]
MAHVPALTFTNEVVCPAAQTREYLERSRLAVARLALGCHSQVANEAVPRDLSWPCLKARKAHLKLSYEGRLRLMLLLHRKLRVFDYVHRNCIRTRWSKRLQHVSRMYGFYVNPVKEDNEWKWAEAVKTQVRLSETDTWWRNMQKKATRRIYRERKQEAFLEPLFDNSVASSLLFEAGDGALRTLAYSQRFYDSVDRAMYRMCGAVKETIEHLVVNCRDLTTVPTDGTTFPQALSFSSSDVPKGDGVNATKKQLNKWWTKVRSR